MTRRLIIPVTGLALLQVGCTPSRQPRIYAIYQGIAIGEPLREDIAVPRNARVDRKRFFWEAGLKQERWTPLRTTFCLGEPTCTETAAVVTDLDGTVIAKHYQRSQGEQFWWALWMRHRWRAEWAVLDPRSIPSHKTEPPKSLADPWLPSRVAGLLRGSAEEVERLPVAIDSVFQLMDMRAATHLEDPAAHLSEDISSGEQSCLSDFIHDVDSLCRLPQNASAHHHVSRLLEQLHKRGTFDGQEFRSQHPTLFNRWYQSGTTTSGIRVRNGNTVSISINDETHMSWILWFLADGWTGM